MSIAQIKQLYTKRAVSYRLFFIDFLGIGRRLKKFFSLHPYLKSGMKVLDAGCGDGLVTKVLWSIAQQKKYQDIVFNGFDVTPAMLVQFQKWIAQHNADQVYAQESDMLSLQGFPKEWRDYDLIVSEGMVEYFNDADLQRALGNLKGLLKNDGTLLLFIAKRTFAARAVVSWWWKARVFSQSEVADFLHQAGFKNLNFMTDGRWFSSTMIVEARKA